MTPERINVKGVQYIRADKVPDWVAIDCPAEDAMTLFAVKVAKRTHVGIREMRGPNRSQRVCKARWEVMRNAHLSGISTLKIGAYLNRDHTTVLHGIKRAAEMMGADQ